MFYFAIGIGVFIAVMSTLASGGPGPGLSMLGHFSFTLTCASISIAVLAVFHRFMKTSGPIRDSLSENAYGIYLLHYMAVLWLQFALLPVTFSAIAKFAVVWVGGVSLPWLLTIPPRRYSNAGLD